MEWMGYATNSTFFLWIRLKPLFDGHVWMKGDSPVIKQPWKPWWRWNLVWTIRWGCFNIMMRFHAENYLEMVRCPSHLASWLGPAKQSWCAGTLSTDVSNCFYHEIGFQVADWLSGRHVSQGSYASTPSYHPTILLPCHSDTTSNDSQMTLPGDGEPTYSGYNAWLNNIEYMLVSYHQTKHTNIWYIYIISYLYTIYIDRIMLIHDI